MMGRPLAVVGHPRRLEIDFCLAHDASLAEIGRRYGNLDPRNLRNYRNAMLARNPNYFRRFMGADLSIFALAQTYADAQRNTFREAAERRNSH